MIDNLQKIENEIKNNKEMKKEDIIFNSEIQSQMSVQKQNNSYLSIEVLVDAIGKPPAFKYPLKQTQNNVNNNNISLHLILGDVKNEILPINENLNEFAFAQILTEDFVKEDDLKLLVNLKKPLKNANAKKELNTIETTKAHEIIKQKFSKKEDFHFKTGQINIIKNQPFLTSRQNTQSDSLKIEKIIFQKFKKIETKTQHSVKNSPQKLINLQIMTSKLRG